MWHLCFPGMSSARILSWPSALKLGLLGKYSWLIRKGMRKKSSFPMAILCLTSWSEAPCMSCDTMNVPFCVGRVPVNSQKMKLWLLCDVRSLGDNPQRWKGKAWIFAYCLHSPSEKLSVPDGVMFCALFHKLCFPVGKQFRVGDPAQKDSVWAQLKSFWSGENTLKT